MFEPGIFRDSVTGRTRWAAFDTVSQVFYFPARYGYRAALALSRALNKGDRHE